MIYNHKLINDLAWAIGSPCLVNGLSYTDHRLLADDWFEQQVFDNQTLLSEQDKSPHLIQTYLSDMPVFKLGLYFENLLAYWFTVNPDFEILHKNLIITSDKKTLGEFDFILRELSTGKVIHLEVAVKFFLQIIFNNNENWLGPNLIDSLDLKFNKIMNKQIELSKHDETKYDLYNLGINIDEHWVILKGRLFKQDNSLVGKNCWLSISDYFKYDDKNNSKWVILPKTHWLAEVNNLEYNFLANEQFNKRSLEEKLNEDLKSSPICIAKIDDQVETKRLFITPNDWESRAYSTLRQPF